MVWFLTADPAPREPEAAAAMSRLFRAPDWEWRESGEVGWWVKPQWRESLLDGEGRLRLEEWRDAGRLKTVKEGPHRVVYRVELPGSQGAVYIKHFLIPNRRAKWRQWFRRGKGRNEARRATRLAAFGVPTIEPVALGERRKRGLLYDNNLISPEIGGTIPLDRFMERELKGPGGPMRRRLAEVLGELTARLHDGGYVHTDFHPGNLLVRVSEGGEPELSMIDLDALRVKPRMKRRDVVANLALLNHSFWLKSSRADRARFLRAYLRAARGVELGNPKVLAREVEGATRSWAERLWRRWGKRCEGGNKYFTAYQGPHAWAVASRDLDREVVNRLLEDPDGPIASREAVPLKDSRTTTVVETTLPVGGELTPVIYKRFNRKKALDPVYALFRPSRGWRAWQNGQHLTSRGVPTPQNLAVIGRTASASGRRRLLPRETYLVTVKAAPAVTLWEYAYGGGGGVDLEMQRSRIEAILPKLSRLVRTMHERSLSHRDLKSANILVEGDGERLSLIDLVGVDLEHPLSRQRRVQNLARLQVSLATVPGRTRTDGLRFLRDYLPWARTTREEWKGLWREVEAACGRKTEQNRRRERKLS